MEFTFTLAKTIYSKQLTNLYDQMAHSSKLRRRGHIFMFRLLVRGKTVNKIFFRSSLWDRSGVEG